MKILNHVFSFVAIALMAAAFGCLKGKSYVSQMADLEKKACACADKSCAESCLRDYLGVIDDMKKTGFKMSPDEGLKLASSTRGLVRCLIEKGISPDAVMSELQKLK